MAPSPRIQLEVDCYAGHRGEETPRRIRLCGRDIEVREILDRWLGPDHRYFKFVGDDGDTYLVRHDEGQDFWELTMMKVGGREDEPWLNLAQPAAISGRG